MSGSSASGNSEDVLEYLCIEPFLSTFTGLHALAAALELGVLEHLARGPLSLEALHSAVGGEARGLRLLLGMLRANQVIEAGEPLALTPQFQTAWKYRELIAAKIDFTRIAAVDVVRDFTALLAAPREFMARAEMFRLFSYGLCYEYTPEAYANTRRWMRITTALTRYEARAAVAHFDFGRFRRMLDIGGNSGEFVLQVCRQHPQLRATVFDLPLVCEIGREHVRTAPEAGRISFREGSALKDPLPAGCDLVSFKSVLHDWPEQETMIFLQRAVEALAPGGTLLIFERYPIEIGPEGLSYATVPLLTFAHSYREPEFYARVLEAYGFVNLQVRRIELELPFFLLTAEKPL